MKKLLCLLLAMVMLFSLVACGDEEKPDSPVNSGDNTPAGPVLEGTDDNGDIDSEYVSFNLGSVDLVAASNEDHTVGHEGYEGIAGKDYTDEATYTYNTYTSGNTNLNWNPVSWETSDDSVPLGYTTSSLYDWRLNSTRDSWAIVPEMAAEFPIDVTADYVGRYGISEGETHKAFKIVLNPDICWADGTPITADDYVYTWQQQLDPIQLNRRADSLYAGNFVIYGAKNYFYQGQIAFTSFDSLGTSLEEYLAQGHTLDEVYVDMSFWGVDSPDGTGYAPASDDTMVRDPAVEEGEDEDYVSAKYLYDVYLGPDGVYSAYGPSYLGVLESYAPDYSWDDVGIEKVSDYEFVFVLTKPVESPEYYIPYNLVDTLIYEPLFESCKRYFDADNNEVSADSDNIASITNVYGTAPEYYMGYGPYNIVTYELDKEIKYERNENWWGYSDGKHTGMYQADAIVESVIPEQATALLSFLAGDIDDVSMTAEDMETYGSSDQLYYTPQSYTTKLSFNTDETVLAERGNLVLANMNFRKAFSLAIDKATFVQSYTASAAVGHGLLNYMYIYDPFAGGIYRETDPAKKAIVDLYGLTYGEDGDFDDLDEAYDAVTGYDLTEARRLMQVAYEQCVRDGYYTEGQQVTLDLRVYSSDETYVKMFNFLKDALESACEGTGFEGNVTLSMTADADYYDSMKSGVADIIFTTWGGAASSPYTMLYECYLDAPDGSGNQMEYGFDGSKIMVTITLDGHEFTNNLVAWALWCDNSDESANLTSNDGELTLDMFGSYDYATQAEIFSRLEYAYLSNWPTVSLYYRNSATLVSHKVEYAVRDYVDMVSFGGIQYMTFNYTDDEWAAVKSGLSY